MTCSPSKILVLPNISWAWRLPADLGIVVTQTKYILDIVHDVGIEHARPANTPLPTGLKFSAHVRDPEVYRRLVGRFLYLGFTRPDISHGAQQLSQFVQALCQQHLDDALHLVPYLKGFPSKASRRSRSSAKAKYHSLGATGISLILQDLQVHSSFPCFQSSSTCSSLYEGFSRFFLPFLAFGKTVVLLMIQLSPLTQAEA
ncbi:UNVERIFIED_CONTAM: hypothetical protein Scaly_0642900 [Sesamum calycinum]|uniref:Mitochondrial protein n=1 Tax=Sesamum calycinum TaxID=2727403 RepID=A0AAW2RTI9_9LAMI